MADGLWVSPTHYVEFGEQRLDKLSAEIASRSAAWDFSGLIGLLPDPDPILSKRGDGAEILEGLTADGHVLSVLQTRKIGTLKREYKWEAGKEGDKSTAASNKLCKRFCFDLEGIGMRDLISALLDAPYYGMTPVELMWTVNKGEVHLRDLRALPNRWFGFDDNNSPRFISLAEPIDGEEIPWGKVVLTRHFPTYDNPYGLRLLSRCFWPVAFKKGGIKFWVTFTEKYGIPFLLGKYRQGAAPEVKEAMLTALSRMVQDAVAIIPEGNSVEMLGGTGKAGGSDMAFAKLVDAMDAEISKVIMGQTLTAEVGDTGSYAAGKVHENVLDDYRDSDQAMVKSTMDEVASIYGKVIAPGVPPPTFSWFESEDPQEDFANRDKTLLESGQVRLTKSYYIRRYGFREDDLELVGSGEQAGGEEFSERKTVRSYTGEQQALEDLADQAIAGVDLSANEALILNTVMNAESYEQAMEELLDIYPDMDMDALRRWIERGVFAAEMYGRMVVSHGR